MTNASRSQTRLPTLLVLNANFVLLWAAFGVSAIGDHLSELALIKERGGFERDDITRVQALISFGFFLPFVLLAPIAGWWADRFSRKWTMIATDLLRAAVMISLSVTVPFLAARGFGDYSIVLPLALTGALAAFFSPCRQAMLPTLVRDDQLVRANALISALGTIAAIVSAVIGGKLVQLAVQGKLELVWNYRLDALTFLVSAALIAFIHLRRSRAVPRAPLKGVWAPVAQGFRYVRTHRSVWQMILIGTVFWAAAGVVISVVPAMVKVVFGGTYTDAGLYRGLLGIGLAIGAAFMTVVGPAMPLQLAVLGSLAGAGCWILALDAAYVFDFGRVFSGLCLVMVGAHGAGLLVTVMATIQRLVPDSRRGRVFGVSDMFTMGAMVLATGAIALPNIPNLDSYVPLLLAATGIGLLVSSWLAWREYRRGDYASASLRVVLHLATFYIRFWCRVKRVGPCTVPRSGPVIVASNHTAGLDPISILATCQYRVISFLVERRFYDLPVLGWFQRLIDCVPIDREKPGKSTFAAVLRLLKSGGCLGVFPQGAIPKPEENLSGKAGIAMFALRSGATVIPCYISGTRYSKSILRSFFIRHTVRVKYGKPIDLSEFRGQKRDKDALARAADLIMREIKNLAPAE